MSSWPGAANPFVPRALPPAPSVPKPGILERIFGSAAAGAKKQFWVACQHFNAGAFPAAEAAFAQVNVQLLPDPQAMQQRIEIYRAFCEATVGNYAGALQRLDPICRQRPTQLTLALLGRLYYVLGQYEAALNALHWAGRFGEPDLIAACREHAANLVRAGNWAQARQVLAPLLGIRPWIGSWLAQMDAFQAGAYYRAGQYEAALNACQAAEQLGAHSPAIDGLRGLSNLALFQAARRAGHLTAARQSLLAARQVLAFQAQAAIDQLLRGLERIMYDTAAFQLLSGNYSAASTLFHEILTFPAPPPQARLLCALAVHQSGATHEAWNLLAGAPADAQRLPAEKYLAGYVARRLGMLDEAHRLLQQLYQERPDFPGLRVELAGANLALGAASIEREPDRAIDLLRSASQLNPAAESARLLTAAQTAAGAQALARRQYVVAERYFAAAARDSAAHDQDLPPRVKLYRGVAQLGLAAGALAADDVAAAQQHMSACLDYWLGPEWQTADRETLLHPIGSAQYSDDEAPPRWKAHVLASYAALLLRVAAANAAGALDLLERSRLYAEAAAALSPDVSLAHGLHGLFLYSFDHDFSRAVQQLRLVHDADLRTPAVQRILAAAALGADDYTSALPVYRALTASGAARDLLPLIYQAYCLWRTGEPVTAADTVRPLTQRPPNSTELVFFCAYLNHAAGRSETAIALLDTLAETDRAQPSELRLWATAACECGVTLARAGQFEAAAALFRSVAQSPAPANFQTFSRQALLDLDYQLAVQALQQDRFDTVLECAAANTQLADRRAAAWEAIAGLARLGMALKILRQGSARSAFAAFEEAESQLRASGQIGPLEAARLAAVRAAFGLLTAHGTSHVESSLSVLQPQPPSCALGFMLAGAYQWYAVQSREQAVATWETGRAEARQRASLLLRLLGMGYLHVARYAEAAAAFADYRAVTGDPSSVVAAYEAVCWMLAARPQEALALFAARSSLSAVDFFLRGYAHARLGAWEEAFADFQRAAGPRARSFAAQAACQVALIQIARGDLAGADRSLSDALRLGDGAALQAELIDAQNRLRRQQGLRALKQQQWQNARQLLQASYDQGLRDSGTRSALLAAQWALARQNGDSAGMSTSAAELKQFLTPTLAARVLVVMGCWRVRQAVVTADQARSATAARLRDLLRPELDQAVADWREALRLDETQTAARLLIGKLAYRVLGDSALALLYLPAGTNSQYSDVDLGEIYIGAGQVFKARVFYLTRWEQQPPDPALRQNLKTILQRETIMLKRFAREEKAAEAAPQDTALDWQLRAQLLIQLTDQTLDSLSPDQQSRARDLRRQIKQALVDGAQHQFESLESDLFTLLGPALMA